MGDITRFVQKDVAYDLSTDSLPGESPARAKTITAGTYQFLALGDKKSGVLIRYKVSAKVLEFYLPVGPAQAEYLRTNYPHAKNIALTQEEGDYVTINHLDRDVIEMLSKIPDREPYWIFEEKFARVP